jgi:hypothetical protein
VVLVLHPRFGGRQSEDAGERDPGARVGALPAALRRRGG